jgi:hypothetical protein
MAAWHALAFVVALAPAGESDDEGAGGAAGVIAPSGPTQPAAPPATGSGSVAPPSSAAPPAAGGAAPAALAPTPSGPAPGGADALAPTPPPTPDGGPSGDTPGGVPVDPAGTPPPDGVEAQPAGPPDAGAPAPAPAYPSGDLSDSAGTSSEGTDTATSLAAPTPTRTLTVLDVRPPPTPPPPAHEPNDFFIGGYGAFDMRFSGLSRKMATIMGARAGVLLGKRLSLGGAMYKVARRFGPPIRDEQGAPLNLKMAYGGATIGLTIVRGRWVELAAHTLIGAGVACISDDYRYEEDTFRCRESVRMVVVEPGANVFFNLADWFRLGVDVGYRAVAREKWRAPNDFMLSGGYGGFSLQFGWFGRD